MGDEADMLAAKLHRRHLGMRAFIGIFLIAVGAGFLGILLWRGLGSGGISGRQLKGLVAVLLLIPVGVGILRKGLLGDGENEPVPFSVWIRPAIAIALAIGAVLAIPMGLYTELAASGSPCAAMLPSAPNPLAMASFEESEASCTIEMRSARGIFPSGPVAFRIEVQEGVQDLSRWMRPFRNCQPDTDASNRCRADLNRGIVFGLQEGTTAVRLQFPKRFWGEAPMLSAVEEVQRRLGER